MTFTALYILLGCLLLAGIGMYVVGYRNGNKPGTYAQRDLRRIHRRVYGR